MTSGQGTGGLGGETASSHTQDRSTSRSGRRSLWHRALKHVPLPGVITRVRTSKPLIALTFDDGPDPSSTPAVIEILERHGAQGTFFMRGEAAARHPDLVRRVAEGGHDVGNHTWSHPVLPRLPGRERRREMRACQDVIEAHNRSRLFRPPYLAQSRASRCDSLRLRMRVIFSNVDSHDWWLKDSVEILQKMLANPQGGDIVLLHDALFVPTGWSLPHPPFPDRGPMQEALDRYLTELRGRFTFVSITELLDAGDPVCEQRFAMGPAPLGR